MTTPHLLLGASPVERPTGQSTRRGPTAKQYASAMQPRRGSTSCRVREVAARNAVARSRSPVSSPAARVTCVTRERTMPQALASDAEEPRVSGDRVVAGLEHRACPEPVAPVPRLDAPAVHRDRNDLYPLEGARTVPVTSTDRAAVELPSRGAVMVTRLSAGARGEEASPPHPHPPTSAQASARRHPAPIDLDPMPPSLCPNERPGEPRGRPRGARRFGDPPRRVARAVARASSSPCSGPRARARPRCSPDRRPRRRRTAAVAIDGQDATHGAPYERDIGMVFQNYALFPHMTVAREHRVPAEDARKVRGRPARDRASEALELVRLPHMAQRYRRAALGRPAAAHRAGPLPRRQPSSC